MNFHPTLHPHEKRDAGLIILVFLCSQKLHALSSYNTAVGKNSSEAHDFHIQQEVVFPISKMVRANSKPKTPPTVERVTLVKKAPPKKQRTASKKKELPKKKDVMKQKAFKHIAKRGRPRKAAPAAKKPNQKPVKQNSSAENPATEAVGGAPVAEVSSSKKVPED